MRSPNIAVYRFNYTRNPSFFLHTLDKKYGYDFFKDSPVENLSVEKIYTGPIPRDMRILPFVEEKYLKSYMSFRSQYIQYKYRKDPIMMGVISAVRGECWGMIYDREIYDENGRILSSSKDSGIPKDVHKFLRSLLTQEDISRIEKYNKEQWDKI